MRYSDWIKLRKIQSPTSYLKCLPFANTLWKPSQTVLCNRLICPQYLKVSENRLDSVMTVCTINCKNKLVNCGVSVMMQWTGSYCSHFDLNHRLLLLILWHLSWTWPVWTPQTTTDLLPFLYDNYSKFLEWASSMLHKLFIPHTINYCWGMHHAPMSILLTTAYWSLLRREIPVSGLCMFWVGLHHLHPHIPKLHVSIFHAQLSNSPSPLPSDKCWDCPP